MQGTTAKLASYLASLQSLDPRDYSRAEQKAYWINFYNALTVQVVADAYPVKSIKDISESLLGKLGRIFGGPWDDVHAKVAGLDLTLNNIEHGILRPIWRDNRIHYAVNCASYGCPNLSPTAFTADNTEELLEAGARAYVNHPRGVEFIDDDFIIISSIYKWYVADFGGEREVGDRTPRQVRGQGARDAPEEIHRVSGLRVRLEPEPALRRSGSRESEGVEQVAHRHAEHFGLRRIATVDDLTVRHGNVRLVRHVEAYRPAEELDVFLHLGENGVG